jgi:hypothetical protein
MDVVSLDGKLHHSHAKAVTAVAEGALNTPKSLVVAACFFVVIVGASRDTQCEDPAR